MTLRNLVNFLLFQAVWFAAVLGAAHGRPWLGVVCMAAAGVVHLLLAPGRGGELRLLGAAALAGLIFDTLLIASGTFRPRPWLFPEPISAPWMIALWVNFATTLNASLRWLHGRYLLAAVFGGIGGTAAYWGGARLGAVLEMPTTGGLVVLAVGWAVMTPLLVRMAERWEGSGAQSRRNR